MRALIINFITFNRVTGYKREYRIYIKELFTTPLLPLAPRIATKIRLWI